MFRELGLTLLPVSAKQYVVVHIRLHNIKGLNSCLIVHSYFQWQYCNGFGLVTDKAAHGHATRDKIFLGLIQVLHQGIGKNIDLKETYI